ncbi:MAG: hypothetical protein IT326_04300, partial [Anaerolineae bacterium]|nr:hypothetical protein [Anaerolineae bacterium]
ATPYVLITAAESSEIGVVTPAAGSTSDCTYDSKYLVDVTIPDGMEMALGARLVKTWQIRNTGTCAWDSGVRIEQIAGTLLRADEIVSVPATAPNEVAEISVRVTLSLDAPLNTPQRATFQLRAPNGAYFGSKPYVEVVAVGSAAQ